MVRENLDLSKYESQIKEVYPLLPDDFIQEFAYELYKMCERCVDLEF